MFGLEREMVWDAEKRILKIEEKRGIYRRKREREKRTCLRVWEREKRRVLDRDVYV